MDFMKQVLVYHQVIWRVVWWPSSYFVAWLYCDLSYKKHHQCVV